MSTKKTNQASYWPPDPFHLDGILLLYHRSQAFGKSALALSLSFRISAAGKVIKYAERYTRLSTTAENILTMLDVLAQQFYCSFSIFHPFSAFLY